MSKTKSPSKPPAPKPSKPPSKPPVAAKKAKPPAPMPASVSGWRLLLQQSPIIVGGVKTGDRTNVNQFNISLILTHHPAWRGLLVYDEFSERIMRTRKVPIAQGLDGTSAKPGPWIDEDTEAARVWFQAVERMKISINDMASGLVHASRQNRHHPVREYLNKLVWDGTKRIDTVLVDYFGVIDNDYSRGVCRAWFISAVARVMEPGVQADYALILEGPQGLGKSRALRHLMPFGHGDWFSETGIVIGNKDSYQNIHGVWIYCLDEMASVHVADVRTMKNFLTSPEDRYRPPFGKIPQNFKRQNIFACTINPEAGGYFADRTGNRRYWPVTVTKLNVEGLVKVRDQIWAEARAVFDKVMPSHKRPVSSWWWPTPALTALCAAEQKKRLHIEPWEEVIARWVADKCPMRDEDGKFTVQRVPTGRGVSTTEVLQHALGIDPKAMSVGAAMKAARILKDLGFCASERETHGGVRDYYYKAGAPILKPVSQVSQLGSHKTPQK